MSPKRRPPRNHLSREQRLERWEAAAIEGARRGPCVITGDDNARYLWLRLISLSSLPPLTRLAAHTLALFGDQKGQSRSGSVDGVFPSIRELARRSGLSERSICTHAEALARSAWLLRERYRVRQEQGSWEGVLYRFCMPVAVIKDPAYTNVIIPPWLREAASRVEPAAAPGGGNGAERRAAPEHATGAARSEGTESRAKGVERDDVTVLKGLPEGVEPDDSRPLNRVQSSFPSELLRGVSHSELQTQCADAPRAINRIEKHADPAEQLRKALKHLAADPSADVCNLYGVSPEDVRHRRSA